MAVVSDPLVAFLYGIGPLEIVIVLVMVAIPVMIVMRLEQWMTSRPCPRCGERVANGKLECRACGYDFDAATRAGMS